MKASPSALRSAAATFSASLTSGEPFAWTEASKTRVLTILKQLQAREIDGAGLRAALRADLVAPQPRTNGVPNRVAIIALTGILTPSWSIFTMLDAGTNVREFASKVQAAGADPSVRSIVVLVDSPGGSTRGIPEAATVMREVRAVKPIVAVVAGVDASAAYWITSNATTIAATPSADIGAIGVLTHRVSVSRQLEHDGIDVTVIAAGKFKSEGCEALPMSAAEKDYLQRRVNEQYERFLADVGIGRQQPPSIVRERFGEGRMFSAVDAQRVGMIDTVETIPVDAVIQRAVEAAIGARQQLAAAALMPLQAELGRVEIEQRRADLRAAMRGALTR